ncbi:hypothetical protein GCM10009083_04440 [Halopseudomonas pertucinogena]|uniref:Uncharacterized protein n=1 Tax=Halopseudomonas pertucinogena TaxID=86175 RepID=A0ABQ2CL55_9GAMM|nr:hypothetical protein GCM10009083_04440 [Halopseudomonas pertucinogena]
MQDPPVSAGGTDAEKQDVFACLGKLPIERVHVVTGFDGNNPSNLLQCRQEKLEQEVVAVFGFAQRPPNACTIHF